MAGRQAAPHSAKAQKNDRPGTSNVCLITSFRLLSTGKLESIYLCTLFVGKIKQNPEKLFTVGRASGATIDRFTLPMPAFDSKILIEKYFGTDQGIARVSAVRLTGRQSKFRRGEVSSVVRAIRRCCPNAPNQSAACSKSFTGTSQNGETSLRSGVNRRCRFCARQIRINRQAAAVSGGAQRRR